MPITVKQNKNGGYSVLRATGTETVSLAELAGSGETVQSASIAEIMWSVDSTNRWTVKRGGGGTANNVAVLAGSGHHDYQAPGMRLETSAQLTSNTTVTLSGGNGYIVVKFHKVSGE
jgi:hypothetical protein